MFVQANKGIAKKFADLAKMDDSSEEGVQPNLDESEFQNISVKEEDIDEHIACIDMRRHGRKLKDQRMC